MLQVMDFRQTRVYQEAYEKGFMEGLEEGRREERLKITGRLLDLGLPIGRIAQATGLSQVQILKLSMKPRK